MSCPQQHAWVVETSWQISCDAGTGTERRGSFYRPYRVQAQPEGNTAGCAFADLYHKRQYTIAGGWHSLFPDYRCHARVLWFVQLHCRHYPAGPDHIAFGDRPHGTGQVFEEREYINTCVVSAVDESAQNWGVKVLRYEIKDLTPPAEILQAMQAQITAEREKRALIAASEGRKQEQINLANGQREAEIARSEGEKQAAINRAEGEAAAIVAIADANAEALRKVGQAISAQGGSDAMNLKVAEQYVAAFEQLAKTNNSIIVPSNLSDMSGLIASALQIVDSQKKNRK